ncbi:MAG: response regulator [Gemmatimonadota bacterium]
MMEHTAVLVIDDETQIRRVVSNALAAAGISVLEAGTALEGIDSAAARRPDLIVLDLALPDRSGLSVCIELRKWSTAPIIVLSASHSEKEKVALLDAGADDYMVKPFSPAELLARVRAQLRRAQTPPPLDTSVVAVEGLRVDLARRVLSREGTEIHLTPTEWDLLRAFIRYAGRTLTHQQIFREVWRNATGDAQAYLRVHVANLRRKIEPDPVRPHFIVTEPGVGYRFRELG